MGALPRRRPIVRVFVSGGTDAPRSPSCRPKSCRNLAPAPLPSPRHRHCQIAAPSGTSPWIIRVVMAETAKDKDARTTVAALWRKFAMERPSAAALQITSCVARGTAPRPAAAVNNCNCELGRAASDSDIQRRVQKEPNHHYILIFYLERWR